MSAVGRSREKADHAPQIAELDRVASTLGHRARTVNLSRAAGLSAALERAAAGQLGATERCAAADLAHQLVGSAGTFGFLGVSDLAGALQEFFRAGEFDVVQMDSARVQLHGLLQQLTEDPGC